MARGSPLLVLVIAVLVEVVAGRKPPHQELARTARWLMHEAEWGTLATTSVELDGAPFGNAASCADGPKGNSSGIPYFYVTDMDVSMVDLKNNPICSFAVSEASLPDGCQHVDPEDPTCVRLTLTGEMVEVTDETELLFAREALFSRHPVMKGWPSDHDWKFKKLVPRHIFILDYYGGALPLSVQDYLAADAPM